MLESMAHLLSVPDVAERFGVTNQTVRNWIADGRLPAAQGTPRGRYRIPADALDAFERNAGLTGTRGLDAGGPRVEGRESSPHMEAAELARVVSALAAALGPDAIILFGSRARGDARPDSDFDLAIVAPDGVERRRLAMKAYEVLAHVEGRTIGVDVVVLTPRLIAAERNLVGSIIPAVVREGVTVYGSGAIA